MLTPQNPRSTLTRLFISTSKITFALDLEWENCSLKTNILASTFLIKEKKNHFFQPLLHNIKKNVPRERKTFIKI